MPQNKIDLTKLAMGIAKSAASKQKVSAPPKDFIDLILEHENLKPLQTPFRITSESMRKWKSMFDFTQPLKLNPKSKKAPGTENFLYAVTQESIKPGVHEQFRRYDERQNGISVKDAVGIFDQSNPKGKLDFLKSNGIDINASLKKYLKLGGNNG